MKQRYMITAFIALSVINIQASSTEPTTEHILDKLSAKLSESEKQELKEWRNAVEQGFCTILKNLKSAFIEMMKNNGRHSSEEIESDTMKLAQLNMLLAQLKCENK